VFSLWSVHGLYSYESREIVSSVFEIGAAPVSEIDIENGARRESWRSSLDPTELVVVELRHSVVING
jgi:hypothetical protein